jgi:hypothetical protein
VHRQTDGPPPFPFLVDAAPSLHTQRSGQDSSVQYLVLTAAVHRHDDDDSMVVPPPPLVGSMITPRCLLIAPLFGCLVWCGN